MSNERLRSAIARSGLTYDELGEQLGVDRKTVERWVAPGRRPYRDTRLRLARLLQEDEALLWTGTESDPRTLAATHAEFVEMFPNRGSVPAATWLALIDQATEAIDMLAFSASFLHDAVPEFTEHIGERARGGVAVRLLFGDPKSEAVRLRGEEEGIEGLLAQRCRLTWRYFAPVLNIPGVEPRIHGSTLYNSLFRFDDALLVNTHSLGAAASQSPVLHLRQVPGGRLFRNYMTSYERCWESARSV